MRPIDQRLIKACQKGDALTVEKLLFRGANPNAQDDEWPNPTALLIAAKYGHLKIITTLIQHGATPRIRDYCKKNALHYAVEKQHHDIAQYLITELQIDPNSQDQLGITPFLLAAENGDIHMLQLLIQLGANPYVTDKHSETALHYTVEKQHHDVAEYLITQLQLDPNSQDHGGITPLIIATQKRDIHMLQLLAQLGANPNTTDNIGQTALHYALENRNPATAQYLITQLHINPNIQDRWGRTPFLLATQRKDIKILQLLAQHGADPNITDDKGQTALHHALEKRYRDIAQYLITQTHINPNIQDQRGYTPFLIATLNGDIDILQLLAQHGADPHTTDHDGRSALHYALEKQYHNVAEYLLTQLQLNPNTRDHNGNTPFLLAVKNGDIHMLQLLIQHGADPYVTDHQGRSALHYALEKRYHNIAQYLLTQLQLDPNTQDHEGSTPFLIATKNGDIKILRLLIQHGANPYVTDHQGRNALHYAVENHRYNLFKYLITQLQLDPNAQNHDGDTPLLIATEYTDKRIANTLIQLGANPHIPNHQGETPASIAHRRIRLPKPQPSTITL